MAFELLDYRPVLPLLPIPADLAGLQIGRLAGEFPLGDHHYTLCIKNIKMVRQRLIINKL
jgi:hypothetical protein